MTPAAAAIRARWKSAIPAPWRRRLRLFLSEAPQRLKDAVPDAAERLLARPDRMPPARRARRPARLPGLPRARARLPPVARFRMRVGTGRPARRRLAGRR